MASTYSSLLRFELPASGEQAGLWGNTENVQLGTLVEQAIAGTTTITLNNAANYTLSTLNGTPDEARAATLVVGGTPGAATTIILPSLQKTYHVRNTTAYTLTFKTSAQNGGVQLYPGGATLLHSDGVNIYSSIEKLWYTQMNFLSQNGGGYSVPQFDSRGNLGLNTNITGTWDSGGGAYSVPTGTTGVASVKPVYAHEMSGGCVFTGAPTGGNSHMGTVVNAVWTGGSNGSMKYRANGPATMSLQLDGSWWWGFAYNGAAGAVANFQMAAYLSSSGQLTTAYNLGISDRKAKSNLKPIRAALDKVKTLTGYTYSRRGKPHMERETGLIAQDVQTVLPEAVRASPDGSLAVAYGNLAGLLVEAIKELDLRLAALEARHG